MDEQNAQDAKQAERKPGLIVRLLRLVGIDCLWGRSQWIVLTRRFPFVVLGLGVVGLLGFGWFVHYSSTPEFCASCHYIKPFVDSWRASNHNTVTCTKCHFPPGVKNFVRGKVAGLSELVKTVTSTQGPQPMAEVEDAACLREGCHETRLLEGAVVFKGKYNFDHTPHLTELRRGKKLRCTSCHSQIVQGEHIAVTESVCFICHFKDETGPRKLEPIAGCRACHEPPAESIQVAEGVSFEHKTVLDRGVPCWKCHFDSVQGAGDVPKQVCKDCHREPDKLEKYADSTFMHNWHVTQRKVECFQCHTEIRHGLHPEPYTPEVDCASCHAGDHVGQREMFVGLGGQTGTGSPSKHSLVQVDCVACHEVPDADLNHLDMAEVTYKATEQACIECHGEGIKGMLPNWLELLKDTGGEAAAAVAKARQALDALPQDTPQRAKAQELLDRAAHDAAFVEQARGVHNIEYALDLLDKATRDAAEAGRIAGEAAKAAAPALPAP